MKAVLFSGQVFSLGWEWVMLVIVPEVKLLRVLLLELPVNSRKVFLETLDPLLLFSGFLANTEA